MRHLSICFALLCLPLAACGNGVDRLDGPGCQPACIVLETEGDVPADRQVQCIDEDEDPSPCAAMALQPLCEGEGNPICGDGAPTCAAGRPACR